MRRLVTFFMLATSVCCIFSMDGCGPTPTPPPPPMTKVFLVRHAEYCVPGVDPSCNPNDPDPELGSVGTQRAQKLAHVLGKANVEAIYTTNTNRTRGTAQPLADMLRIVPFIYADSEQVAGLVLAEHAGDAVLIVGHQPTVPEIIGMLGGDSSACTMDSEHDNLCVVVIPRDAEVDVIHLQYGESSP